jgi:hypothetical protein
VEHFGERSHGLVGPGAVQGLEEGCHLLLPAGVDLGGGHAGLGGGEVLGLQIADEQAVLAQEQRVVVPAGRRQGVEHLRPDGRVPRPVLVEPVRPDLQQEAHALHEPLPFSQKS